MRKLLSGILILLSQQAFGQSLVEVTPIQAEGLPVEAVEVFVIEEGLIREVTGSEYEDFLEYFNLQNKGIFHPADFAITRKSIESREEVSEATFKTFNGTFYGPVTVRWYITVRSREKAGGRRGLFPSGTWEDFPLLYEDDRSELTFILNGGAGTFLDHNGFFGQGDAFTQGSPVADQPAGFGSAYWSEVYIEPGIGGIAALREDKAYVYGAVSGMFTSRLGADIFSSNSTVFGAFERAYIGILLPRLGKNKNGKLDISAGRNFFQLNDGFLFSKVAGSANAGDRGSLYLSGRTAMQKTVLATFTTNRWRINSFFIEPQELFRESQTNINYTGGTVGYNDNKKLDVNLTVLQRTGGAGTYQLPEGESLERKGLWVLNPKLWLSNLFEAGIFLKSEFAYQFKSGMRAYAWYLGGGIRRNDIKFKPSLYYRYAFMQGDNPETRTYERFDALLSSGLGDWVQGINYRKTLGNGNLRTHRIELKGSLSEKWQLALDAFFLRADQLNNLGGLVPISTLSDTDFGREFTANLRYYINQHFLLQGVVSRAIPGKAILNNLPEAKPWQTFQLSLFMFY